MTNANNEYEYVADRNVTPGAADPALQQYGYQVFSDEEANSANLAKAGMDIAIKTRPNQATHSLTLDLKQKGSSIAISTRNTSGGIS